jgi:hypothetical protein
MSYLPNGPLHKACVFNSNSICFLDIERYLNLKGSTSKMSKKSILQLISFSAKHTLKHPNRLLSFIECS